MLQNTKTRSSSTRHLGSTSRLGLGGHLPNPAYLVGCTGTAVQRSACPVELAGLGCLDCRARQ
jgi:hypothetical protein